ncbi:MAG: hypothetical protein MI746_11190 [Pseudomonadales bacterium]|nr:hypothetical protein [Pseudomonadales bacterium]
MTWFIFAGDMLVMAFMIGLAIWVGNRANDEQIREAASIPLQDEEAHG